MAREQSYDDDRGVVADVTDGVSTSSSIRNVGGLGERALQWLLLSGNRIVVAAGLGVGVFLLVYGLIDRGLVAIGPGSRAATVFASGLISGTLTLVTVALSINQLILSRVFGSPGELADEMDGTRALRARVQRLAGEPSAPNDPAAFLSLIAKTLRERTSRLASALDASGWDPPAEVTSYVGGIDRYGENVDAAVEPDTSIVDVLEVVLGTEYAENLTATEHLRNGYREQLPGEAEAELAAISDLLESIAITRQFFKTLSLQQDFARLSRLIAYTGLLALLASVVMALLYRTDSTTIQAAYLPVVFALGVTVIVTPLSIFIAYILRAATIARRTVSVGPFVPPGERS